MEFNSKLQQLRMSSKLTQEQLAEKLFVSRVTVSKWESGRGYPNIDSLKLIAKVFSVSVDDLLSTDELIIIAENHTRDTSINVRSLFFGFLDLMPALLFILPCCGNELENKVEHVALPAFEAPFPILIIVYSLIISTVLFGVMELAMQNIRNPIWLRVKIIVSSLLSVFSVMFFIMIRQPYGTAFLFCLLLFKVIILLKKE